MPRRGAASLSFFIIAVDGPSGVGKSTLARMLAEKLDCLYVDTGAMFRCVAWCWRQGGCPDDESRIKKIGLETRIHFDGDRIWCNGKNVSEAIRSESVSALASKVSRFPVIRDIMKQQQRKLVEEVRQSRSHAGAVLEGRDIGTKVFPKADFKFFIDADPIIRAQRRVDQLRENGKSAEYRKVLDSMLQRDQQDRSRAVAPLRQAKDACWIDTGEMGIDQVLNQMLQHIQERPNVSGESRETSNRS